jgi:polar amino acid transport system permease protein
METIGSAILTVAGWLGMNTELLERYGPRFVDGFKVTVMIVVISMLIGAVIAFPTAMARMSHNRLLRGIAYGYVYFFRGTPLLAQLFLIYAGLGTLLAGYRSFFEAIGVWWILREGFYYVLLAFALNTGAYQAEILRGGIEAVSRGQTEAGEALGLHSGQIFRKIILPQALLIGLRPLGNELILMIKASSVASIVTVFDVMGVTRLAFSRSYDFQVYLWAAIVYLLLVETIRRLWDSMEWRMTHHLRPATSAQT